MVTNNGKSAKAQNGKHTNHAATEEHIESQHNTFNYTTKTYWEIENAMMHVQTHTLQKKTTQHAHTKTKSHTTWKQLHSADIGQLLAPMTWISLEEDVMLPWNLHTANGQRLAKSTNWVRADKGTMCAAYMRIWAHLLDREIRTQCCSQERHERGVPTGAAEFGAATGCEDGVLHPLWMCLCWGIQTFQKSRLVRSGG